VLKISLEYFSKSAAHFGYSTSDRNNWPKSISFLVCFLKYYNRLIKLLILITELYAWKHHIFF